MSNCSVLVPSNNSHPFFTYSKPLKATRSQQDLKEAIEDPTTDLIGPLGPSAQMIPTHISPNQSRITIGPDHYRITIESL